MIKCVLLNAHCTLIAEVVEVDAEIGDPNCKLIKPYVYNSIDDMIPWKADITNQTEFMIRSEDIEVRNVEFKDGLLTVKLGKIVPEHHARKEYL